MTRIHRRVFECGHDLALTETNRDHGTISVKKYRWTGLCNSCMRTRYIKLISHIREYLTNTDWQDQRILHDVVKELRDDLRVEVLARKPLKYWQSPTRYEDEETVPRSPTSSIQSDDSEKTLVDDRSHSRSSERTLVDGQEDLSTRERFDLMLLLNRRDTRFWTELEEEIESAFRVSSTARNQLLREYQFWMRTI